MAAIENGSICFLTKGKNAGEKVIVVEAPKGSFAMVEGATSKKRKCNVMHLWPTGKKTSLASGATKKDIRQAIQQAGV
jgi:large subunit ribosomal protein L14e